MATPVSPVADEYNTVWAPIRSPLYSTEKRRLPAAPGRTMGVAEAHRHRHTRRLEARVAEPTAGSKYHDLCGADRPWSQFDTPSDGMASIPLAHEVAVFPVVPLALDNIIQIEVASAWPKSLDDTYGRPVCKGVALRVER